MVVSDSKVLREGEAFGAFGCNAVSWNTERCYAIGYPPITMLP